MKIANFLLPCLLAFAACKQANTSENAPPANGRQTETAVADWPGFWPAFNKAVQGQATADLAGLCVFPLVGTGLLDEKHPANWPADYLATNFEMVFDEKTRAVFAAATDQNFMTVKVTDPHQAEAMNAPLGTEVKVLSVQYIFDEGTESQTETAKLFNFAVVEGQYKLISLLIAG